VEVAENVHFLGCFTIERHVKEACPHRRSYDGSGPPRPATRP
jgi:hypothetical protein